MQKMNTKSKIYAYAELMRILNSTMMGFAVIIGIIMTQPTFITNIANIYKVLFGYLTGFFLTSSSMVFNDIVDKDIDLINQPKRPIPSKRVSVDEAKFFGLLLGILGIISSIITGTQTFTIAVLTFAIALLYNFKAKKTGILGNLLVSYTVMIPIIYGSLIVGAVSGKIIIYSFMIFLANTGREIIKGIADIVGDSVKGIKTVAVKYGAKNAALIATSLVLAAIALSLLPPLLGYVGLFYNLFVSLADILFLYNIYFLLKKPNPTTALKVKRHMLFAMLLGLLGFALGSI